MTIALAEFVHRIVQNWTYAIPINAIGCGLLHGVALLALSTALFTSDRVDRGETRGAVQPTKQFRMTSEGSGFAGKRHENLLRHVLSAMRVVCELPQGSAVHEIDSTGDELRECALRAVSTNSRRRSESLMADK